MDNVVRASSQVINEVLLPQFERIMDLKMGQIKTEMMQEMKGTLEEMMVPFKKEVMNTVEAMKIPLKSELKEELTGTVEAMKTPLKAELKADFDQQITNRLEEQVPDLDTIVTASSTIANNILMPQMEQKVTIKVNEIRGIVKSELKSELDQDLSSGMTDLSQQIVTKINEREEAIDEKIIFAVARKSDVAQGQPITFDTVIANIGESMDATSGTFTAKRKGLYMFTFTAVFKNDVDIDNFTSNITCTSSRIQDSSIHLYQKEEVIPRIVVMMKKSCLFCCLLPSLGTIGINGCIKIVS